MKGQAPPSVMINANIHTLIHTNMQRGCRSLFFKLMRVVSAHHLQSLLIRTGSLFIEFRNVHLIWLRDSGLIDAKPLHTQLMVNIAVNTKTQLEETKEIALAEIHAILVAGTTIQVICQQPKIFQGGRYVMWDLLQVADLAPSELLNAGALMKCATEDVKPKPRGAILNVKIIKCKMPPPLLVAGFLVNKIRLDVTNHPDYQKV